MGRDKEVRTTIDQGLCIGCGRCVRICPTEALAVRDGVAQVVGKESLHCGHCAAVCPVDAVQVAGIEAVQVAGEGEALRGLLKLMKARRSCREYREEAVSLESLESLVRAGSLAPSGTNSQGWTFTLLPDRESVVAFGEAVGGFFRRLNRLAASSLIREGSARLGFGELKEYYEEYYETVSSGLERWESGTHDLLFHGAPSLILIGGLRGASTPTEDAMLATQNLLLTAEAMGLGTCLVGFAVEALRRDGRVGKGLGLAPGEVIYSAICVGHPKTKFLRPAGRKPLRMRIQRIR